MAGRESGGAGGAAAALPQLGALRFRIGDDDFVVFDVPLAAPAIPVGLTAAERGVTELALLGLSNAEIAWRRHSAPRTVANQLASVFQKAKVGSRAELVARCTREGW